MLPGRTLLPSGSRPNEAREELPPAPTPSDSVIFSDSNENATAPFETIMFIPLVHEVQILELPALDLFVVAHDLPELMPSEEPRPHWSFYLAAFNGGPYVNIDPICSGVESRVLPGGTRATIMVTTAEGFGTPQHVCTISTAPGCVVGSFIDAIVSSGRDTFDFQPGVRGGRGWIRDIIDAWTAAGLIEHPVQAHGAKVDLLFEWPYGSYRGRQIPIVPCRYHHWLRLG